MEGNALVLKAVTEDEAGTMFFSLDNMKFNLLDDGKLCLIAEDDAEESDDGEEADDSETGEVDFSVKTYFEKIMLQNKVKYCRTIPVSSMGFQIKKGG